MSARWNRMNDRRARQNIRAAERHGVSVRFGSDLDDVHAFHDLHRNTRKRKHRLLAQPVSFFENIWKAFAPSDSIANGAARLAANRCPIRSQLFVLQDQHRKGTENATDQSIALITQ